LQLHRIRYNRYNVGVLRRDFKPQNVSVQNC
jgi:hypothetical protein